MKNITFCLITCGEKTEKDCLKSIESFRDKIVFHEIRNIYPQIKALNKMIKEVETTYLIPLDADIILNNDAYDRIIRAIDKYSHDPNWHSILFNLWDTLTEREILALKILRTDIIKIHPFIDGPTPDVEHFSRLTNAGYSCITNYLKRGAIGKHIVKGNHFCYHKYRDVYMTLRTHGREWDGGVFIGGKTLLQKSQKHFNYFLHKYLQTMDKDYICCIAGMIDGITSPLENKSKNLQNKINPNNAIDNYTSWVLKELNQIPIF